MVAKILLMLLVFFGQKYTVCIAFWFLDVREKPEVGVANAPADGA
jgi:hypothetical protein